MIYNRLVAATLSLRFAVWIGSQPPRPDYRDVILLAWLNFLIPQIVIFSFLWGFAWEADTGADKWHMLRWVGYCAAIFITLASIVLLGIGGGQMALRLLKQ